MKQLLLTGFEPFLEHPINPTVDIVKEIDGTTVNGIKINGEILTVDFAKSGSQLLNLIKEMQPDAVISLGLAEGRYKVTPERIAINCNDGPKDNKGYRPKGEVIIEGGKDGIFTTLPIKKMIDQLHEEELPATISNSAGTYLCNNVMYHALHYFEKNNLSVPSGFIHIPASHSLAIQNNKAPSWSHEDLTKAVQLCIECL